MTLSAGPGCSDTQSRPLCLLRREVMPAINGSDLYLGARLVVARTASKVEAAELLGIPEDEMWDARDHVLAAPDQVQRLDPNRVVPRDVLRNLSFVRADGTETGLKFDADGGANQQTLRTVRELTDSSALALDALIDWEASPQSPPDPDNESVERSLFRRVPGLYACFQWRRLGDMAGRVVRRPRRSLRRRDRLERLRRPGGVRRQERILRAR